MRTTLNEDNQPVAAPAAGQPAQQQGQQKVSPAVQKLEKKFSSIKIDDLLGAIKQKGDATAVLALIAAKLGGDKLKGSEILKKATTEALEAEKELNESFDSVNGFVRYLFE